MALEIPLGTVLSLLINQVVKTALAAKDVLIQRESFRVLSQHLSDIEPVLRELQRRELNDSQAARNALEFLAEDVKVANDLVEKYKNRSRFYLLLKCRHIVKEIQDVTRLIGRSLAALPLASVEVLTDVSEQVNRLHNEMQRAQFEASQAQLQIVQKLDQGLKDQKVDQGFANDMLADIAKAVGVAIEPSEISKELASFRQEKEEAAVQKNRAEEYFLEQVIQLLSRADAAKDQEEIKKHYFQRVKAIEKEPGDYIPPFPSFICPIERRVMVDPVSLCSGTTCEKEAIESWINNGQRIDPKTEEPLEDLSLSSNHLLRKSIEEWRELNYCLSIRSAKRKLLSEIDSNVEEALVKMQDIMTENPITKDWISIEGLVDKCLSILGSSHNRDIKWRILIVLKATVEGHITNKEKVIESQGIDHIAPCLGRSSKVSNAAIDLLFDLLQDGKGWNVSACRKLSEQSSAILFLVMLMNTTESTVKAEKMLLKLCDDDDANIIRAAEANWYKPLIDRLVKGPQTSRLLMVKTLVQMELVHESLKCLGEAGAIPPLLELVSGNLESKENALSALVKLSTCHENKKLIASAGGVRLILDILLSSQVRTIIIARCCEILERLSSNDDGTAFLVDADGNCLELDQIVNVLLAFQKSPNLSRIVRKPALHALLGICKSQQRIVMKTVVIANGVSVILPMLDDSDQEIQEASLNLLYRISHHEPQGIVEFLLLGRRLDKLVCFLNDDSRKNAQMAAVGLLANLPKSETDLTKKLIESDGLQPMVKILGSGTIEAKENALSAISRFTDPKSLESQRLLVELGLYPLLLSFLKSGTVTAKARAAALIGNLSLSSPKLTVMPKASSCWCFRNTQIPICKAHGGICSVRSTFCILQADALPELVRLLHEKVHATAYEALQALFTLVSEDKYHKGAIVLHEANAISPIMEVLNWGNPSLKEESLHILEKVFLTRKMVELYGGGARLHLIGLTTRNIHIHEDDALRSKATRVMVQLDRYSRSSMSMSMPLV
ncbi:U-box domain-containing protein [Thalictrum thalictroides]|uniref:RING-type E3 ubiquitin transferase n=1 Tax=Thalictrum thalictroides TaxID=46969 RepID=A0A7J6WLL6_THATH|nr:U-box domain-containing protein [Thalictrum thalictroides]